jgi:cytochrome b subunit of formate dehydrogenase
MDRNYFLYAIDCAMAIFFTISIITGLFKWTILLRLPVFNTVILPSAQISDIHDWSGILLGSLVFLHLYMHRRWIAAMTRKVFGKQALQQEVGEDPPPR